MDSAQPPLRTIFYCRSFFYEVNGLWFLMMDCFEFFVSGITRNRASILCGLSSVSAIFSCFLLISSVNTTASLANYPHCKSYVNEENLPPNQPWQESLQPLDKHDSFFSIIQLYASPSHWSSLTNQPESGWERLESYDCHQGRLAVTTTFDVSFQQKQLWRTTATKLMSRKMLITNNESLMNKQAKVRCRLS